MLRSLLFALVAVLTVAAPASGQQYRTLTPEVGGEAPGARVALVIGNADYEHATPLRNPTNDAEDVAEALRAVGFTVVTGTDLSHEAMDQALADFAGHLDGADVALLYYAGHGVQVDGANYLIPVDANVNTRSQVKYRALDAAEVLAAMEDAGAGLKMVVLDACRNDPFRAWRGGTGGLSAMQGPTGSVIIYATGPGSVASDNPDGRNGLYTAAFLRHLETPGLELSQFARRVAGEVRDRSGGEQEPWLAAAYINDFYFVPGREGTSAPPPPATEAPDDPVVATLRRAADAQYEEGEFRGAAWLYRRALEHAPSNRALRDRLADAERGLERELDDQRDEARRQIEAAVQAIHAARDAARRRAASASGNAQAWATAMNAGADAFGRQRYDEAIRQFAAAVAADPSRPEGHVNLGYALLIEQRYGEAADRLEAAVALGGADGTTYEYLAQAYFRSGQPWRAYVVAEEGGRLHPEKATDLANVALNALGRTDAYAFVVDRYEEAVTRHPGDPLYRYNFGSLLLQIEDNEQARTVLERVVEQQPRNADARYNLGTAYFNQGLDLERWGIQDEARPLAEQAEAHFAQALHLYQREGEGAVAACAALEKVHLLLDRPPSDFAAAYPSCD